MLSLQVRSSFRQGLTCVLIVVLHERPVQMGGVLAELQAEQARLRQLCSDQAAAMQDLQRQANQAAM